MDRQPPQPAMGSTLRRFPLPCLLGHSAELRGSSEMLIGRCRWPAVSS